MTDQGNTVLVDSDGAVQQPAPEPVVVDTGPTEDEALGATFDRLVTQNGADRGQDGKFVSPNGASEPAPAGEGVVDSAVSSQPAVSAAPAHLPQAVKAEWAKLSPEGQTALATLTTEWDRKFGEQGKQLGMVKPIADKLTSAVQNVPEFKGMSAEQLADGAIYLASVQSALNKDPVNTILQVADTYGVLAALKAHLAGTEVPATDSGQLVARLEREIEGLRAEVKKTADPATVRSEFSKAMAEKDAETLTQTFASGAGKEYWADVEADLPTYIAEVLKKKGQGRPMADVLSDAYDMAINAIPEVRAKVRASEAKATAANPDPKRTEAARKAASINVKAAANGKDRVMSEEEALGAAYDRQMAN